MHNLLFCAHAFWLNYVTVTFLLVSSSSTNHDLLCFVHGQGRTSEQKHRTKSFSKLHNPDLPLLTMVFVIQISDTYSAKICVIPPNVTIVK